MTRVYQPLDSDGVRWWKYHGIVPKKKLGDFYALDFPIVCKQLNGNDCLIYETRPESCREFDCSLPEYADIK